MKKLMIIGIVVLIFLVIFLVIFNNNSNEKKKGIKQNIEEQGSIYDLSETIDLENTQTDFEEEAEFGTDNSGFGKISDYYKNSDVKYEENKIILKSYDGLKTISDLWIDKGMAQYIKEPDFGNLKKFIYSDDSISANYEDVKMKNATSYINEITALGFNDIKRNEKNNKKDYYIYSAKKGDITFTLKYKKGEMYITVF